MAKRPIVVVVVLSGIVAGIFQIARAEAGPTLFAGAARENVTPFTPNAPGATAVAPGSNPAATNGDGLPCDAVCREDPLIAFSRFEGTVTPTGIWGEPFTDANGNGRYDAGEPFTDDPKNTALDADSVRKWDGTYLAGFGRDRAATGALDPITVRVAVFVQAPPDADLQEQDGALHPNVAIVSADFLGYYSDWTNRILENARSIYPFAGGGGTFFVDRLILTHTHNHSSPDVHVGMWGPDASTDGTYPLYERYVERKIAVALVKAMMEADRQALAGSHTAIRAGVVRGGDEFVTERGVRESLAGMQARSSCRTPWFFDDELRALQAVDAKSGRTILSMINWGTRNASLGPANTMLSSDFAGYARAHLESRLGGESLWMPGAEGAVDIVGNTCTGRWTRHSFDGESFPGSNGEIPLGAARTRAIGRVVGDAAFAALQMAELDADPAFAPVESRDLYVHVTNQAIGALAAAGVVDKPGYVAEKASADGTAAWATDNYADGPEVPSPGVDAHTTLHVFRLGPASFVTAPGELFPELYYGTETYNRQNPLAYDVRPSQRYLACSGEARRQGGIGPDRTGRPYEPPIREQQIARFDTASVHFMLGHTSDLLGPVVPGYDYSVYGVPLTSGFGVPLRPGAGGAAVAEAPDDCARQPILQIAGRGPVYYGSHHHETNSVSSMLGPAVVCTLNDLLQPQISWGAVSDACGEWSEWKTATVHNPLWGARLRESMRDPLQGSIRHY